MTISRKYASEVTTNKGNMTITRKYASVMMIAVKALYCDIPISDGRTLHKKAFSLLITRGINDAIGCSPSLPTIH